ncbi:MAG: RNA-binding protein [Tannerella sp.]|jgi:RNA recognition motif-containing protein|nr:RNA-binding protein [Tannerella sp.]
MNIYISGLSYNVNDADLNELFTEYGEISSARVITDRETGRSRGFGFVEMPNEVEAQKAIDELNGVEYDGKVISVSVARPRTERSSFGGGGGGDRNRRNNGHNRRY